MTSTWRGIVKLDPQDHELWALVQKRVRQKQSWETIAAEIGCETMALVDWVNAYKSPSKPKIRNTGMTPTPRKSAPAYQTPSLNARRFANWRKAKDGARAALEKEARR